MATKNNPGKFDCYANAMPDEPMFVLLARDSQAPFLIERWAEEREWDIKNHFRPSEEEAMVSEARECANAMREWRKANDGKWRK
jgi:hypothetical protein